VSKSLGNSALETIPITKTLLYFQEIKGSVEIEEIQESTAPTIPEIEVKVSDDIPIVTEPVETDPIVDEPILAEPTEEIIEASIEMDTALPLPVSDQKMALDEDEPGLSDNGNAPAKMDTDDNAMEVDDTPEAMDQ
jgi:hypothetical protein